MRSAKVVGTQFENSSCEGTEELSTCCMLQAGVARSVGLYDWATGRKTRSLSLNPDGLSSSIFSGYLGVKGPGREAGN